MCEISLFMHKLLKSVKGRCRLSAFNPQQFSVTYRQGSTPTFPFIGRRYTLTHSEQTDDLFLWIDEKFAVDQLNEQRNELLPNGSTKTVLIRCMYTYLLAMNKRKSPFKPYGTLFSNRKCLTC